MKKNTKIIDAEFRDHDEESGAPFRRRARGGSGRNVRHRYRGSWVTSLVFLVLVWPFKLALWLASGVGWMAGELTRVVVVPILRFASVGVAFTAMSLGVMYLGAYAIRDGVRETRTLADHAHAAINSGTDALLALVPNSNPERQPQPAPRAIPIPEGWREGDPLDQPETLLGSVGETLDEAINGVGLLLPSLSDWYPRTENLPPIDGDILERAGGHRMQMLITGILPAVEQVESSGRQELIGDNGLAFGPLQVRHEPCEDLAQFFGVVVKPEDCNGNYALSEYVVRLYLGYWGAYYERQTGKTATAEVLCRTWNGGPDQGPRDRTDIYWGKCKKHDSGIAQLAAL